MKPQEIIERITSAANYDDCIVIVEGKSQTNLRWASSTLTTNGHITEQSVTVIAFVSVPGGMATSSITYPDVAPEDCQRIAQEVGAAARASGAAEDYAELIKDKSIGDWNAEHLATSPEVFKNTVGYLGEIFAKSIHDGIELFGYAEHTHRTTWVGSKGGLRLRFDQPDGRIEMTGKSHSRSRSTWEGVATRDFSNVDIAKIDGAIRTRLDWQGNTRSIPAGRYDTVFPSGSIADLYTYMLWSSAGKNAAEGRSVFSNKSGGSATTRIGEKLANLPINIYSDSSYPGLESSPFVTASSSDEVRSVFDNGMSLRKSDWFTNGELSALIQTRASAQQTNLPYVPIGENFIIDLPGASGSLEDLIKKVDHGLLVTTLWYIRMVDPTSLLLTGLTRDGVYEIKGGEVVGAVNNFRWNDSPVELLKRIKAVGATCITQPREWAGDVERVAAPPMILGDFNMSTISQAN
jgi:predicted Zn-dependent protease